MGLLPAFTGLSSRKAETELAPCLIQPGAQQQFPHETGSQRIGQIYGIDFVFIEAIYLINRKNTPLLPILKVEL